MTIKTHGAATLFHASAGLRGATNDVETLFSRFHWHKEGAERHLQTTAQNQKMEAAWRAFCRLFDRVVYAAGGRREGCTWLLFGAEITAETLWDHLFEQQFHDPRYSAYTPEAFLTQPYGRSAHNQMRLAALLNARTLPGAIPRKRDELPAPGGKMLQTAWQEQQEEKESRSKAWADWENQDNPSVIDDDDEIPF